MITEKDIFAGQVFIHKDGKSKLVITKETNSSRVCYSPVGGNYSSSWGWGMAVHTLNKLGWEIYDREIKKKILNKNLKKEK